MGEWVNAGMGASSNELIPHHPRSSSGSPCVFYLREPKLVIAATTWRQGRAVTKTVTMDDNDGDGDADDDFATASRRVRQENAILYRPKYIYIYTYIFYIYI